MKGLTMTNDDQNITQAARDLNDAMWALRDQDADRLLADLVDEEIADEEAVAALDTGEVWELALALGEAHAAAEKLHGLLAHRDVLAEDALADEADA